MKVRVRYPAWVSSKSLVLALVVDLKPATTFARSRSMKRMTDSSENSLRSLSVSTTSFCLLPLIEDLTLACGCDPLSFLNLSFYVGPSSGPAGARSFVEVAKVCFRPCNVRDAEVGCRVVRRLCDQFLVRQILEE